MLDELCVGNGIQGKNAIGIPFKYLPYRYDKAWLVDCTSFLVIVCRCYWQNLVFVSWFEGTDFVHIRSRRTLYISGIVIFQWAHVPDSYK